MPENPRLASPTDIAEKMQDAAEQLWNRVETDIFRTFSVQDLLNLDSVPTATLQTWLEKQPADPGQRLATRDLFTCALVLCEAARPVPDLEARLEKLFVLARAVQFTHTRTARRKRGNFYWWIEGRVREILQKRKAIPQKPIHIDPNGTDFCMRGAALLSLWHRHLVPEETRTLLKCIILTSIDYCIGFSVPPRYTNIAMMNAMNLMLLGREVGDHRALRAGIRRFRKLCIYTWEWGIHEFTSPNYTAVHLYCLGLISRFGPNPRIREQAGGLLDLLWTNVALSWMRYYERLGGAMSRVTHKLLFNMGGLPFNLWTVGWLPKDNILIQVSEDKFKDKFVDYVEDPLSPLNVIYQYLSGWESPPWIYDLIEEDRLRPDTYTSRQSWGWDPTQSCTYFYDSTISLGTASAPYNYPAWEDIPLVANLSHRPDQSLSRAPEEGPEKEMDDVNKRWFCDGRFFFEPIQLKEEPETDDDWFDYLMNRFLGLTYGHPVPLFWAAAQRRQDALGIVLYSRNVLRQRNKTAELDDLYSCFALNSPNWIPGEQGESMSIWIDKNEYAIDPEKINEKDVKPWEINFSSGETTLSLSQDQALVFCQMDKNETWNAVGLRIVWNAAGEIPAKLGVCLVSVDNIATFYAFAQNHGLPSIFKGNIYAALLAIRHSRPDHPETDFAGTAFWTRIGRGSGKDAFEQWRQNFARTHPKVDISKGWDETPPDRSKIKRFRIEVESTDGHPLRIQTRSLNMRQIVSHLTPAPSRAVLEMETEDRAIDPGRMILESTPLIRAYEQRLARTPPVKVPGYWQAARGRVQKPMVKAEKTAGGTCVWVPRFGLNGEGAGSVAWRLNVPRNDVYYIWARTRSKPGRGAFRICLYRDRSRPLYQRRWLVPGIDGWTWVPMDLNELDPGWRHTPLRLPKGEVTLQIFAETHSHNIGIDRLFITSDPHKRPTVQTGKF